MSRRKQATPIALLNRLLFMKVKLLNRGFTLIEIVVGVSIMLFLVGGGIASYITFNDRQYKVAMAANSNVIEVSAVCDNNGSTEEFLRQTAELDASVTSAGAFDVEFNVLHGGATADTDIFLISSGERWYTFSVTQGGELTAGELADPNQVVNEPSPSSSSDASPSSSANASASPSSSASASPSGSGQTTTGVVQVMGTATSCSQKCVNQGYTSCVSIGTDSAGTNGKFYTSTGWRSYQTCFESYGSCSKVFSDKEYTCSGKASEWTNCKCQTTTSASPNPSGGR